MTTSVLVAYATKYGSTREVAEAVGVLLREYGLRTEVRPAREY
jgi:menaquinone-dependent protoporphyrinogen oxidase